MSRPILKPLSTEEEFALAAQLLAFFGIVGSSERFTKSGGRGAVVPSSVGDAYRYLKAGPLGDSTPHPLILANMVYRLTAAGLLTPAGATGRGSPPMDSCYFATHALTKLQRRGTAWLTVALGWEHLLRVTKSRICQVLGHTKPGDERAGSGLVIAPGVAVTNQHVLADMAPSTVVLLERRYSVTKTCTHPKDDVGIVYFSSGDDIRVEESGIPFRPHRAVEPILTIGYPSIPFTQRASLTAQSGETCGESVVDLCGRNLMIFSAVARPGNSGGPIFGRDGRVVGIVTRTLERDAEDGERLAPVPFFAGVPAEDVRRAVEEMDPAIVFPWETWDQ